MTEQASVLPFDLLGYRAIVTAPDADMLASVAGIFGDLRLPGSPPADAVTHYRLACDDAARWSLFTNETCVYTGGQRADALIALEWHLVTNLVAYRRDYFHLHAAALADPSESCGVLVVGASGSGKTTLTLGLMARGFLPYADDVTLIAPMSLMPQPLQRAFHTDDVSRTLVGALGGPPVWRSTSLPPGYTLPARWAAANAPVQFVLFPTLAPTEPPALVSLSIADAVTALLPYSMTLDHNPALALGVAARLTRHARCYALSAGDLGATVECVRALVAGECAPAPVL